MPEPAAIGGAAAVTFTTTNTDYLMALRAYDEPDGGQPLFVALAEAIGDVPGPCHLDVGLPVAYAADAAQQHITECPDHPEVLAFGWACSDVGPRRRS